MDVRTAAFNLLVKTFKEEGYSNYLYESAVKRNPEWADADRRFLKALYFGVLRNIYLLDYLVKWLYKGEYSKLPENIKFILRMGIYQINSMDKVPHYAIINEAVNLAKKVGHIGTAKLVNALLRRASREPEVISNMADNLLKNNDVASMVALTSHPEWLVNKYVSEYGHDKALSLLNANNSMPSQNYRVSDFDEFEKGVDGKGLNIEKNLFNRVGVSIESPPNELIEKLRYEDALSSQDQSSLIAVSLMDGASGRVLELCCGRGNKTGAMLKYIDNKAIIINIDRSISKLRDFQLQNRSLPTRCFPICCDVLKPLPFIEKYQYVFLDAPCSGLGVVRRHPEIKYRQSQEKVLEMTGIQYRALSNAAEYLDINGKLIYSVCSFEREETSDVVNKFLSSNPGFSMVDIGTIRPDLNDAGLVSDGFLKVFPGSYGMDGFFSAVLKKNR
jgi:16S rRNA (cytosine967-C5)-methyltransferase